MADTLTQDTDDVLAAVRLEPYPRRVRGYRGHTLIVDSTCVFMLFEDGHLPVWYFPPEDVHRELLAESDKHTQCPRKGTASYFDIRVDDRVVPNAVWTYPTPIDGREDIAGLLAFYFNKLDNWYEEDDEVFVHPRSPYHRVDVLNSSRHVRIEIDGVTIADTTRPRLLFETGLATRYYIPRADVRMDLLEPSDTHTRCPYKGVASYYSAQVGDRLHEDLVWTYPFPIPECPKVEGLLAFWNERVDLYVDGELQERPEAPRRRG
jgi:uncharacterized protein (DUF427 family)